MIHIKTKYPRSFILYFSYMLLIFLILILYSIYLVRFSFYRSLHTDSTTITSIDFRLNNVYLDVSNRGLNQTVLKESLSKNIDDLDKFKNGDINYKIYSDNSYQICIILNTSYDKRKKIGMTLDKYTKSYNYSYYDGYSIVLESTNPKKDKYVDCYMVTIRLSNTNN